MMNSKVTAVVALAALLVPSLVEACPPRLRSRSMVCYRAPLMFAPALVATQATVAEVEYVQQPPTVQYQYVQPPPVAVPVVHYEYVQQAPQLQAYYVQSAPVAVQRYRTIQQYQYAPAPQLQYQYAPQPIIQRECAPAQRARVTVEPGVGELPPQPAPERPLAPLPNPECLRTPSR